MYEYNINVLKQQYNLNDEIDLTKPKTIIKQDLEDKKNNCIDVVDCANMTINEINEVINK